MPYTHFRYIAYEVPTATFPLIGGDVVCDYDPGELYQAIGRLPVPATVPDDARKRLQRFAGVVNLAANSLRGIGDNPNTLKIFMAPEFYFRPLTTMGADYYSGTYPVKDQVAILEALNGMFAHLDFRDWLFVPGTLLWNTRVDVSRPALYFNTLVHVQGGQQNALNVIEKHHPSPIDGMPVVGVPEEDVHYSVFHVKWKNRKKRVAEISGKPMGFDVCLDHQTSDSYRILKGVLHDWNANEGHPQDVALHLLCAAGMSVQAGSVAARPNGYILRNDGIADPGARSQLIQVQRYEAPAPSGVGQIVTTAIDMNGSAVLGAPVAEQTAVPIPDGALRVPSKGAAYASFTQRIAYYPTLAMP